MKRLIKAAIDEEVVKKVEQILERLTRKIGRDGDDPVTMHGNVITKEYRNWEYFTDRPGEEDDDWADFTSQSSVLKMVKDEFLNAGLEDKIYKITAYPQEKKWFTVQIELK
jgi:hypothetical protein